MVEEVEERQIAEDEEDDGRAVAASPAAARRDVSGVVPAPGTGEQWQRAASLLRKMLVAKTSPTSISYIAAISACEKCERQWQHSGKSGKGHQWRLGRR